MLLIFLLKIPTNIISIFQNAVNIKIFEKPDIFIKIYTILLKNLNKINLTFFETKILDF